MTNIIKTQWHDKAVKVAFSASFMAGLNDRTLNFKITVEETTLLPSSFARGHTIKANADILIQLAVCRATSKNCWMVPPDASKSAVTHPLPRSYPLNCHSIKGFLTLLL